MPDSLVEDRDDERLERLSRAHEYVPLNLYDEVTKLSEYAVADFINERDKAIREVGRLRSAMEDAAHFAELGEDVSRFLRERIEPPK